MSSSSSSSSTIRVLLAGMATLNADLIRRAIAPVEGDTDILIVRETAHGEDLLEAVAAHDVDVVVTGTTSEGVPEACQRLVFAYPAVPVIAIRSSGTLEVYHRREIFAAGIEQLRDQIRSITRVSPARSSP